MAFEFRLETLLRIRKRMEEAAKMEHAAMLLRREGARRILEQEQGRLRDARMDMERCMEEGIMSDEFQLKWFQVSYLEKSCRKLVAELEKVETDLERGKTELARRHIEKEVVANLRNRDLRRYLQEVDRQIQKELDDLASLKHRFQSRLRPA